MIIIIIFNKHLIFFVLWVILLTSYFQIIKCMIKNKIFFAISYKYLKGSNLLSIH